MRKNLLLCLVVCCLFAMSCSKNITRSAGITSSSNPNFKIDGTGVTLADASKSAILFLKNRANNQGTAISITPGNQRNIVVTNASTIMSNGKPYFHVINTNSGYVILSADSLYIPVLAYDSISNFSYQPQALNPGLQMWMNKHAHQIDLVRNQQSAFFDSVRIKNKILWQSFENNNRPVSTSKSSTTTNSANTRVPYPVSTSPVSYQTNTIIGPLVTVLWGQDYPFNYNIQLDPAENGTGYVGHDPVGCSPVAAAQVMSYYKFPASWNWSSMPIDKYAAQSLAPGGSLPALLLAVGQNMKTTYSAGGSSTTSDNINNAFQDQGYTSYQESETEVSQTLSGQEDGTDYANLLISNIAAYHPCVVSAVPSYSVVPPGIYYPSGTGHTWVCDGSNITYYYSGTETTYSDGSTETVITSTQAVRLLHMNWGWDVGTGFIQGDEKVIPLTNNGWYNADTDYTQADSQSENFQYFQILEYNIHP